MEYYSDKMNAVEIKILLQNDINSKQDAVAFSEFVLAMIDNMARDMEEGVSVLGNIDNTSMIPDIDYEVSLYLANRGYEDVWDEACDKD